MAGNGHLNYVFNEKDFQEENSYKRGKLNVWHATNGCHSKLLW